MECVRSFQQNKLYAKQNPYNPFDPRAKKTYMTYMFKIITEVVGVSPEASGDKNEGKIVEVECVRSFQDDKLFAKKNL